MVVIYDIYSTNDYTCIIDKRFSRKNIDISNPTSIKLVESFTSKHNRRIEAVLPLEYMILFTVSKNTTKKYKDYLDNVINWIVDKYEFEKVPMSFERIKKS